MLSIRWKRFAAGRGSAFGLTCALAFGALSTLGPASAQAHFHLTTPTNWTALDSQGAPQKTAPCGNEGAPAANGVVNEYTMNSDGTTTVSVTLDETVTHAGWYRVAIAPGPSSSQTATTLPNPPTPPTTCAATIENPAVLPIVADDVLRHPGAFPSPLPAPVTISITLPALPATMACTMTHPCTLQIVEVMNDGAHFPPGCFYHHCADIAIHGPDGGTSSGPPDAAGSGASSGSLDSGASQDASVTSGSSGTSGASTGSGASSAGASGAASSSGVSASSGVAASGGTVGSGSGSNGASSGASSGAAGGGADGASTDAGGGGGGGNGGGGCSLSGNGGTTFAFVGGLVALSAWARRRRTRA